MSRKPSSIRLWKKTILSLITVAAAVLLLQYPTVMAEAENSNPAPTQTQTAPQPAAQPAPATPATTPAEQVRKPAEPPAQAAPPAPAPAATPAAEPAKAPEAVPAVKPEASGEKPAAEEKEEEEKEEGAKKSEGEALDNQSCMDCHNPDILKKSKEERADDVVVEENAKRAVTRPPYVAGKLNLSINDEEFKASVHADTTCVQCHADVAELPHKQYLKPVNCKECHEDSVEAVKASAHGDKAGVKAVACISCHDVHYGKGKDEYGKAFQAKVCIDCHKVYGMDVLKGHASLYEPALHMKLGCMVCHTGKEPGVHNIPQVKTKVVGCEACHTKFTVLAKEKPKPMGFFDYIKQTSFINGEVLKKFGYVLGANRIPALDALLILVVVGTFGLPIVHGGLRFLTRRKEPLHLPEEKILLHPLFERVWHWFQALCIVMLCITGIMLHWPELFPGWFHWAVSVHNWFGMGAVGAFVFWLLYNLITGRITHYIPKKGEIPGGMIRQAKFYGYGIFKHEPHPYAPTEDNKFNPLQKIAYLKFQLLLLPILLLSGLLYMFPECFKGIISAIGGMAVLGTIHLILGALFAAFLVAHLYLATTGETVGENFKAIILGYGIKSDHDEHHG